MRHYGIVTAGVLLLTSLVSSSFTQSGQESGQGPDYPGAEYS